MALDLQARTFVRDGVSGKLSAKEQTLMAYLLENSDQVVSRDALGQALGQSTSSRAVDMAITRLRKKIERKPSQPEILVTEYGQGYRLVVEGQALAKPPQPLTDLPDSWVAALGEFNVQQHPKLWVVAPLGAPDQGLEAALSNAGYHVVVRGPVSGVSPVAVIDAQGADRGFAEVRLPPLSVQQVSEFFRPSTEQSAGFEALVDWVGGRHGMIALTVGWERTRTPRQIMDLGSKMGLVCAGHDDWVDAQLALLAKGGTGAELLQSLCLFHQPMPAPLTHDDALLRCLRSGWLVGDAGQYELDPVARQLVWASMNRDQRRQQHEHHAQVVTQRLSDGEHVTLEDALLAWSFQPTDALATATWSLLGMSGRQDQIHGFLDKIPDELSTVTRLGLLTMRWRFLTDKEARLRVAKDPRSTPWMRAMVGTVQEIVSGWTADTVGEIVRQAEESGDPRAMYWAYRHAGARYSSAEEHVIGESYLRRALAKAIEAADPVLVIRAQYGLALMLNSQGREGAARALYEHALQTAIEQGMTRMIPFTWRGLAPLLVREAPERALALARASVKQAPTVPMEVGMRSSLAYILLATDNLREAEFQFRSMIRICERENVPFFLPGGWLGLGICHTMLHGEGEGDFVLAETFSGARPKSLAYLAIHRAVIAGGLPDQSDCDACNNEGLRRYLSGSNPEAEGVKVLVRAVMDTLIAYLDGSKRAEA